MKAKELMIGDWIKLPDNFLAQVVSIAQDGIYFVDSQSEGIISYDNIRSIPLTAEILEKNFGEKVDGMYFDGDEFVELYVKEINDGTWLVRCDHIEFSGLPYEQEMVSYVHELQHFLKRHSRKIEL